MSNEKWDYLRLDSRSISLFRILLGLSILYNFVFIKLSFIREFYDAKLGLFSQKEWIVINGVHSPSVFDFYRNETFAYIFIFIAILICIAFIAGIYTRVTAILLLLFYYNIQAAVSGFCFGYDFYTYHFLFWSIFLPLSNHFYIKSKFFKDKTSFIQPSLLFSFVIILQIAIVYFTTGVAKAGPTWLHGYAVRTMSLDKLATFGIAPILRSSPLIYTTLTYLTLLFEILFPLLLFVKFKWQYLRFTAALILVLFHLSVFLSYNVANFSITGFAAAAILLPTGFWERLQTIKLFSFLHKNAEQEKQMNRLVKRVSVIFVVFASVVMVNQSFVFMSKQLADNHKGIFISINNIISKLELSNPFKFSFFLQNWKMFAPNPPPNCGWLAIEEVKDDGFVYDLISDELVKNGDMKWRYESNGYERQLLNPMRSYHYRESWKYRMLLKKWILYKVHQKYPDKTDYTNLSFCEYDFFISKMNRNEIPPIEKKCYPIKAVMDLPIFVAQNDTSRISEH